MKTSKRLRRNIAIWLAAGLFMTGTAGMAAGPIMPDPKAEARHQPQVEETANGIPLVNITAPSSGTLKVSYPGTNTKPSTCRTKALS